MSQNMGKVQYGAVPEVRVQSYRYTIHEYEATALLSVRRLARI
jgi:hypothetical protein